MSARVSGSSGDRLLWGGLFRLAFRRAAPLAFVLAYAVLLALAATRDGSPSLALDPAEGALVRGLARSGAWSLFGLLALPFVALASARSGARWRRGESDWLAPTPASRSSLALSAFAGTWAAGLVLALATALAGELAARGGEVARGWRWQETLASPALALPDGAPPARWEASAAGLVPGARLLLHPTVAPGSGPAVGAAFSLASPDARASSERRIHGRSTLALDVPAGARAPLALELARAGEGAVLVLPPDALELVVPAASERLAGLELLVRAALLLAAALALAQGLGALMRPALAAGCVLALALLPHVAGAPDGAGPAGDFLRAWSLAGRGLVPAPLAPALWIVTALALAGGLALHRLALVRGGASA